MTAAPPLASPQVTEFSQTKDSSNTYSLRELADQQKRRQPKRRDILLEPGARRRKYEIETGVLRDGTIRDPLEPWTCPVPGGMTLYGRLMMADDGQYLIGDYSGDQLTALAWMQEVELVSVDTSGRLHALSDARSADQRSYPGAPCSDRKAAVGCYLRGAGTGLVLAAIANLCAGRSVRRSKKRKKQETLTADGIPVSAAEVCAEANRIMSRRRDLKGFRYLSLSRCREIIRDLIGTGELTELVPPRAARRRRSWLGIPRVIAKYVNESIDRLGRHRSESREREIS